MARILNERNIYFAPLQILHDVIFNNVPDPNKLRAEQENPKDKKWIFPTTPEANDENYPRIALIHGRIRFEKWGADRLVTQVIDVPNKLVREIYADVAVLPVTVGIFCKKTTHKSLEVKDWDNTTRWVENSAQVAYLLDKVQNEIKRHREEFILKDIDFEILNAEGAYEDNEFLWAGNIDIELYMKNIWTVEYKKIIETISFDFTVE